MVRNTYKLLKCGVCSSVKQYINNTNLLPRANSLTNDPVIFGGDPDLYLYPLNNGMEVQQQQQ